MTTERAHAKTTEQKQTMSPEDRAWLDHELKNTKADAVWRQLQKALHGENGHGGNTAEIYACKLVPHPMPKEKEDRDQIAAVNLTKLLRRFQIAHPTCEIQVNWQRFDAKHTQIPTIPWSTAIQITLPEPTIEPSAEVRPAAKIENRERFFQRLYPFFSPKILRDIELAYILAKAAHRSQKRMELDDRGEPVRYFEHVRRATLIGIELAQVVRPDTVIATILHDGIEDTRDLRPEMIEHVFGPDICGIVKVLSKDPKDGYLDRFSVCTDWRPYFVKACDRLDNLRSTADSPVEFRRKQVAETRDRYFRLFDRMVTLTPEEYRDGVRRLREQIMQTTEAIPLD